MKNEMYQYSFPFSINDTRFIIHNNSSILSFQEDSYRSTHCHHVTEIHYVYQGNEKVSVLNVEKKREDVYNVSAGQLLLIRPYMYHAMSNKGFLSRLTFTLEALPQKDSDFSKYVAEAFTGGSEPLIVQNKYLQDTFDEIRSAFRHKSEDNLYFDRYNQQLLLTSAITYVINLVLESTPAHKEKKSAKAELDREYIIKNFFCVNFSRPQALEALAELLHLSTRQTQTEVERVMGKNFKTLALEMRMKLADMLIRCTDKTLTEISDELDYSSYSSFYTAFMNYFGISPTEYKKQNSD